MTSSALMTSAAVLVVVTTEEIGIIIGISATIGSEVVKTTGTGERTEVLTPVVPNFTNGKVFPGV